LAICRRFIPSVSEIDGFEGIDGRPSGVLLVECASRSCTWQSMSPRISRTRSSGRFFGSSKTQLTRRSPRVAGHASSLQVETAMSAQASASGRAARSSGRSPAPNLEPVLERVDAITNGWHQRALSAVFRAAPPGQALRAATPTP
jgi:hypothetical protein